MFTSAALSLFSQNAVHMLLRNTLRMHDDSLPS